MTIDIITPADHKVSMELLSAAKAKEILGEDGWGEVHYVDRLDLERRSAWVKQERVLHQYYADGGSLLLASWGDYERLFSSYVRRLILFRVGNANEKVYSAFEVRPSFWEVYSKDKKLVLLQFDIISDVRRYSISDGHFAEVTGDGDFYTWFYNEEAMRQYVRLFHMNKPA